MNHDLIFEIRIWIHLAIKSIYTKYLRFSTETWFEVCQSVILAAENVQKLANYCVANALLSVCLFDFLSNLFLSCIRILTFNDLGLGMFIVEQLYDND